MSFSDDLTLSLIGLTLCVGLGVLGFRNHFAEKTNIRLHRPPWMIIALASLATGFMIIVHLANLFGFETGNR
jgi:cytochrome b subunit of formate dehydrogenase